MQKTTVSRDSYWNNRNDPYWDDRIPGHVWLGCYIDGGEKYWIQAVRTTCDIRKTRRLYYRMCKKLHLNPKKRKEWYYE